MIVYRGPTEAFGGGMRNWGGTVASQPNIAKNSLVCWASVPSLPGCPGSPLPETTTAWASPGPVMRAWEGPFASAGVASAMVAAMLMPAARAAATVSLRSIGRLLGLAAHSWYTAARCQVPARPAQCQRAELAMASAAALPTLPSSRSATCLVPQTRVLPVVSRAEAMAETPLRVMYTSSCGPLIHKPLAPFTSALVTLRE